MLPIFGWLATFAVGFVLGLLGGGGSILIVPVLVYLFLNTAEQSTSISLLIVGLSTGIGLFVTKDYKFVQLKTALVFAIPSSIGAFISRKFLVPLTPNVVGPLSKDTFLLVLFSILMLIVSIRMVLPSKEQPNSVCSNSSPTTIKENTPVNQNMIRQSHIPKTVLIGLVVGTIAGYLGAGGGFLIVPALNQVLGLSMVLSIPTSLAIIAAQSIIGFSGALGSTPIDWTFVIGLTLVATFGLTVGSFTKKKINPNKLKPVFGYFVLSTGIFMLIQELLVKRS